VDYFQVLDLLSCLLFLHFALGSTGNRDEETKGGRQPRADRDDSKSQFNWQQSETYRMVSVTRIPPLPQIYTHKNKDKGKKKNWKFFFFFLKGNDSDQFFRSLTPLPVISILLLELLHSVDKRLPARERQHTHNTYTREEKNEEKKNKTKRKSSASDHDDDDAQLTRPTHRRPNLSTTGTVRCGGREWGWAAAAAAGFG
jgi:hypothetical protein